jgi:hypothetical protein
MHATYRQPRFFTASSTSQRFRALGPGFQRKASLVRILFRSLSLVSRHVCNLCYTFPPLLRILYMYTYSRGTLEYNVNFACFRAHRVLIPWQFLYRQDGLYNVENNRFLWRATNARGHTRGTYGTQCKKTYYRDSVVEISPRSVNILYQFQKNNNKKNTIMYHTYAQVVHDLHVDKIKGDSEDSDKGTWHMLVSSTSD